MQIFEIPLLIRGKLITDDLFEFDARSLRGGGGGGRSGIAQRHPHIGVGL